MPSSSAVLGCSWAVLAHIFGAGSLAPIGYAACVQADSRPAPMLVSCTLLSSHVGRSLGVPRPRRLAVRGPQRASIMPEYISMLCLLHPSSWLRHSLLRAVVQSASEAPCLHMRTISFYSRY